VATGPDNIAPGGKLFPESFPLFKHGLFKDLLNAKSAFEVELQVGLMLAMGGECQGELKHSVPHRPVDSGRRINLTIRAFTTPKSG